MSSPKLSLTKGLVAAFFQIREAEVELERCATYKNYYEKQWLMLRHGVPAEADSMQRIGNDHIIFIVEKISTQFLNSLPCHRAALREALRKDLLFQNHSEQSLNGTISLALRLWLALNIREDRTAPGTRSVQWNDAVPLQDFITQQFKIPRLVRELGEKSFDLILPSNFTAVNLRRFSGIKIDWVYDLNEHLELDGDHRRLKIFSLKYYLHGLRISKVELIPNAVIDEYMKTMNFLFPDWDDKTRAFLQRKQQTFGMEPTVGYPGPLYLFDFHFWRNRLARLYTEFCSPPPSVTQLFNDRRNVLQWYTFWFAVLIVGLTFIFGLIASIAACLQTKYSYQALLIAIDAASSAKSRRNWSAWHLFNGLRLFH